VEVTSHTNGLLGANVETLGTVADGGTTIGTTSPDLGGRLSGDPYVAGKPPGCGESYPPTRAEEIGATAIRCAACGAETAPFRFTKGSTIAFDERRARHNAGAFGSLLVGARCEYGIATDEIGLRTDGHIDIDPCERGQS
jgi:hypothetical protein